MSECIDRYWSYHATEITAQSVQKWEDEAYLDCYMIAICDTGNSQAYMAVYQEIVNDKFRF